MKTSDPEKSANKVAQLYEQIVQQSVDAYMILDLTRMLILDVNDSAVRMLGYKGRKNLLGKKGIPRMMGKWSEAWHKKMLGILRKKGVFIQNVAFKVPVRGRVWANMSAQIMKVGKQKSLVIRLSDVTEEIDRNEELAKTERYWGNIMKNLRESFVVINKDCRIIDISNMAAGFKREDVIGGYTYNFVPEKFADIVKKKTKEAFKKAKSVTFETAVDSPEGDTLWYSSILIPNIEDGEVINVVSISSNITEQKNAEEQRFRAERAEATNVELKNEINERIRVQKELDDSKNYIENMINSSPDAIVGLDDERSITSFNLAAERIFGYKEKEVLGKHIGMLAGGPQIVSNVKTTLQNKARSEFEIVGVRKNGEKFPLYISTSVLLDKDKKRMGSVTIARDITKEKKREEQILASEKKYRELIENSQTLILSHHLDGEILTINSLSAKWIGYEPKQIIGKKTVNFIAKQYQKEYTDYVRKLKKDKFTKGVVRVKDNKGKDLFWSYKSSLRELDGKPYVTVYLEDITEHVRAEQQVKESLREKEVLLREVHHRVKNNLQVISSILNLQSSYVEDQNTLNILRESQNRIKAMAFIHESLYQAKNLSHINFAEYIENLSDNLFRSYGVVDGSIEIKRQIGDVFLNLDIAIPCGLIVHELIANALKYAFVGKKGGTVDVSMTISGRKAILKVEDDGIGLPKDLDIKQTKSLGLRLVMALAEQIGGKLTLQTSDAGSHFKIAFDVDSTLHN
ncbi:MAG: PAS domain S-box protein [Flavobacteriales bacterium]|nr:PAS domain S-box protein [Flavobacteriales bacterium]